tara:strand:+ start:165 stop:452 length:288 start_codon:yes stop_codon:yes gene_type:complete
MTNKNETTIIWEDDSDSWEAQRMLEQRQQVETLGRKAGRFSELNSKILEELEKINVLLDFIDRDLERIEREDLQRIKRKGKKTVVWEDFVRKGKQ